LSVLASPARVKSISSTGSAGGTVATASRDDLRQGRLALAAQGPASFASLIVDGIDAYRYEFVTSRFTDFAAHIKSFRGVVPR
jgi:hypothetical protein